MNFDLLQHTILVNIAGSRSYGMHRADSDIDIKGVCIPPPKYIIGALSHFEQADKPEHIRVFETLLSEEQMAIVKREKLEGTVYSLQKFIRLATDANPNIIESLFCRENEILLCTDTGKLLRENRNLFLSAKAKHTFSGYAFSQLKRIKGHRQWLLNPPSGRPKRSEFGLMDKPNRHFQEIKDVVQKKLDTWEWDFSALTHSEILALKERLTQQLSEMGLANVDRSLLALQSFGCSDEFMHTIIQEKKFQNALRGWKQYNGWKQSRNPSRAALEEKYGYDTKHAAHLVRLLRMGNEILRTGTCRVWRGGIDAQELSAIRNGLWSYEQLIEWSQKEQEKLQHIYQSNQYVVPQKPNRNAIEELCCEIMEQSLLRGR